MTIASLHCLSLLYLYRTMIPMRQERRHRPLDFVSTIIGHVEWAMSVYGTFLVRPPPRKGKIRPPFPMNNYYGQTHKKNVCDEIPLAVVSPLSEVAASPTTTTTTTADACHCRIQQQYETMAIRALTNAARAVSSKAVGTSSSSSRGFSVLTAAEEFPG